MNLTNKLLSFALLAINIIAYGQTSPSDISFVRQGVQRLIFDEEQSIPLAILQPESIVGMEAMHPVSHYLDTESDISIKEGQLSVESKQKSQTSIWFAGFNPFATYTIDVESCVGQGEIGFEFSDKAKYEQYFITIEFDNSNLSGVRLRGIKNKFIIADESIAVNRSDAASLKGKIILQMLGSGLVVYLQESGLPKVIGQSNINKHIDLRKKEYMKSFQTHLHLRQEKGEVVINSTEMAITSGAGQADIRPITYENGDAIFDKGRLWFTMSIRGRELPHQIQGVFSLNPTVFDIQLEGIIVFDRNDGLLRNEIASHIFYDRKENKWCGITTGFSSFANPDKEKKKLLAVESIRDPRFGFSIMNAKPLNLSGDIEDPHIIYDIDVKKWRMLACVREKDYRAVMFQSEQWDRGYTKIAGPVIHNSTGTSIQKINGVNYCFSGSNEREIFIYTYPDLKEAGTLNIDLPPWDANSGTRVWPNVVQLPDGYPFKYIALMMDRYNYPGMQEPNWSYGAIYLYHGFE